MTQASHVGTRIVLGGRMKMINVRIVCFTVVERRNVDVVIVVLRLLLLFDLNAMKTNDIPLS
jgi:hypothetical protein